jgi:hypothetical protein
MKELYEKVGAIHVHSVFSDGSGHYSEIIRAASEVGLEFLLFADHWTLEPKKHDWEGFYDGVLIGIGCELNDSSLNNHLLAFEIDKEIEKGLDAVEYTRRVAKEGGWAVVAHPDERRNALPEFPAYPWTAWESEDFHALEIWNHLSEWMERLNRHNKLWLYLNPRRSVIKPTKWTLETWDKLNLKRRVVGIGGVDAHAHHYPIWRNVNATIFPYKVAFKSIHAHVLLEDQPERERTRVALKQLFDALRSGHLFIANRYVGDAKGFRFWAEDTDLGNTYLMGDRLKQGPELIFRVSIPRDATQVWLVKDSEAKFRFKKSGEAYCSNESGVYRIEARRHGRAFIFSNAIVIEP